MGTEQNINPNIQNVLVTGGNGFVGRAIIKILLESKISCRVVGRNFYPELDVLGVECVVGDIADQNLMIKATEGVDTVFHVAALAGISGRWQQYYATNVLGTRSVIKACRGRVSRLVYTSTPSVVFNRTSIEGGNESLPYPTSFLCHYAKSKMMAEKEVLDANGKEVATCALRPHLIWGPGDPHLIPRLVAARLKNRLKIVGKKDNVVDISYIDNVAHAHILAANNLASTQTAAGKPYFISQDKPVNLWDWLNDLFKEIGVPELDSSISFPLAYSIGACLEVGYAILKRQDEPPMTRFVAEQLAKSHYFSIANAQKDLGYVPLVSTEEGLKRLVSSLKKSKF